MLSQGFWLDQQKGNNFFSYQKRGELGSERKIWINHVHTGPVSDLQLGDKVVFEEIDHHGQLQSQTGLKYFLVSDWCDVPIFFVDNHNYVLWFWYQEWLQNQQQPFDLIHIDQHTDMNPRNDSLPQTPTQQEIFDLVFQESNVGNFIPLAQQLDIVHDITQINTEFSLHRCHKFSETKKTIVDIDLDFWVPEMGIEYKQKSFEQVRKFCQQADVITVATSPFFLDQNLAMELVEKLFVES